MTARTWEGGPGGGRWVHEARAWSAIWIREFKVFQREKSRVVSAMATPIFWIVLIGTGFNQSIDLAGSVYEGVRDYRAFMYPGIIAMSTLFGTVFFGLYIVWDRKLDVLKEVLVAPVSRATIFFGKVAGGSTEALIQGTLLLAAGLVVAYFVPASGAFEAPADLAGGLTPATALLALGFVALLALAFTSVGLFIGSFFESLEGFQVVVSFLIFPLFFLSGALFPLDKLPGWLQVVSYANPVTYAVDGMRGAVLGVHSLPYWVDAAGIGLFALVMLAAGTWSFSRMK